MFKRGVYSNASACEPSRGSVSCCHHGSLRHPVARLAAHPLCSSSPSKHETPPHRVLAAQGPMRGRGNAVGVGAPELVAGIRGGRRLCPAAWLARIGCGIRPHAQRDQHARCLGVSVGDCRACARRVAARMAGLTHVCTCHAWPTSVFLVHDSDVSSPAYPPPLNPKP